MISQPFNFLLVKWLTDHEFTHFFNKLKTIEPNARTTFQRKLTWLLYDNTWTNLCYIYTCSLCVHVYWILSSIRLVLHNNKSLTANALKPITYKVATTGANEFCNSFYFFCKVNLSTVTGKLQLKFCCNKQTQETKGLIR